MDTKSVFNGKNIVSGLSENLEKVVTFLLEKEAEGSFRYSDSIGDWDAVADIIQEPLKFGYHSYELAAAVGLAYVANLNDGRIDFPDNGNLWSYAHCLHFFIHCSGWPVTMVANVIRSLGVKEDMQWQLGAAIREYSHAYYDNGLSLLGELPSFESFICAGLMEGDYERFCQMFPPLGNQSMFLQAVLHTCQMSDDSICKAYDVSKDFVPFDSQDAMAFLLMMTDRLDGQREADCKERALVLLRNNSSQYAKPVCDWFMRHSKADSFWEKCVVELISGLDSEHKITVLKMLDKSIPHSAQNADFLKKIVFCVADAHDVMDVLLLKDTMSRLSYVKDEFVNLVLSFILHHKGMYRVVGRRLWDEYHLESYDFSPESLSEIGQVVFIRNMLQDLGNPETRLPKIVPLFNSSSKIVLSALMQFLHNYTDEYMGHVVKCLDDAGIDTSLSRALKEYVDKRHELIEKRRTLKELSPMYAQYASYEEARRTERVHVQQLMAECENNSSDSFMNLSKKKVLARGGGWRNEDGTTNHLVPIQMSIPAPIMLSSMIPLDNIKWTNELLKDYESETGDC